ncbi:MAG: TonB-dependent receptor family protein [Aestuariibaculum sp.]
MLVLFVWFFICVSWQTWGQKKTDSLSRSVLKEVVVFGYKKKTSVQLDSAIVKHRLIAGSTVIAEMKPKTQRLETLKDALKLEPGIMVQEFFGANDQPRLSIRGSGIQSNPQRRGVYLMQDGIPVNFADGSFVIGVMDPVTTDFVEVFKGANALTYGAATLGGVLDFNSRRGSNKGNIFVKSEAGAFDYTAITAMGGKKWETWDFHTAISSSRQKGFRLHNENEKLNVSANVGFNISKNITNRSYANYSYINFDIPGPLTYNMLLDDPTQITEGVHLPIYMGADIARDKPKREVEMLRLANKTAFTFKNSNIDMSVYYQYANDRFVFPIALSTQHSFYHDFGLSAIWKYNKVKHRFQAGLISGFGKIDRNGRINKNGLDSYLFSKNKLTAFNVVLFAEEKYKFNKQAMLVAGIQGAYNLRNSKDVFPDPELRPWYSHSSHKYRYFFSENISLNQDYFALNPRLGFIYNASAKNNIQFFANTSWSYEPPTFDELVGTEVTNNINTSPKKIFAIKLNKQQAFTAEIGTRSSGRRFSWNIAAYKSWLKDEILEVKDFTLGIKTTKNYPNTIHNGLELGFSIVPLQYVFSNRFPDKIILKGTYNYSDFFFSSGEYKGKQLAGIPKHYLAGALQYNHPTKINVELNVEYQPTDTPIDHENTLMQPSFSLFGFKVAYQGIKNFSFYIEGKNILDKRYASSYIISDQIHVPPIPFPDFTAENMAFYIPGSPRAYYLGMSYEIPINKRGNKK